MPAFPKAAELHIGITAGSDGTVAIICNDVFCPCSGDEIMTSAPGTYLNMRHLDRAINAHITTARTNAEREIYA